MTDKDKQTQTINVIVDASRAKSGGAINHLTHIVDDLDLFDIDSVDIFGTNSVINRLSFSHPKVRLKSIGTDSLILSMAWQMMAFPFIQRRYDRVLVIDGATFYQGRIRGALILQDLIAFEEDILREYYRRVSLKYFRQICLRHLTLSAISRAEAVIFMTDYHRKQVLSWMDDHRHDNYYVVNHGVDVSFKDTKVDYGMSERLRLVYVSPIWPFKNHKKIIDWYNSYPQRDNISIDFIGPFSTNYGERLALDEHSEGIRFLGRIDHDKLPEIVKSYDVFLFASSCESFGITLLEGMALGMPVICNKTSSLPEILGECGEYFQINQGRLELDLSKLFSKDYRESIGRLSAERSNLYSWRLCSNKTLEILCKR